MVTWDVDAARATRGPEGDSEDEREGRSNKRKDDRMGARE
jgi:hypothetical protein